MAGMAGMLGLVGGIGASVTEPVLGGEKTWIAFTGGSLLLLGREPSHVVLLGDECWTDACE